MCMSSSCVFVLFWFFGGFFVGAESRNHNIYGQTDYENLLIILILYDIHHLSFEGLECYKTPR